MKKIIFPIILIIVAVAAAFVLFRGESKKNVPSSEIKINDAEIIPAPEDEEIDDREDVGMDGEAEATETVSQFTLSEVSMHAVESDCWIVFDEKVYDVTEFIKRHPGGRTILEGCGKDGTNLFETRPMGSGTPHSDRARSFRENYYIGDIKK